MFKSIVWIAVMIFAITVLEGESFHSRASAQSGNVEGDRQKIVFGTYIESAESAYHIQVLAESLRQFGGHFAQDPIWVYQPATLLPKKEADIAKWRTLDITHKSSSVPEYAAWFYYAGKVFAAAVAEQEAVGKYDLLIWLDEDTIILKEPRAFNLSPDKSLGYRPVMHQNIGSTFAEQPDKFWSHLYQTLAIPESANFLMITAAGKEEIRPYFNAGCLVVRPERGLFQKWAQYFTKLSQEPFFIEQCKADVKKRIFLHQAALTGAILKSLPRAEMVEIPHSYNYPIFFDEMYGAPDKYNDITEAVTIRYDIYFRKPAPDWDQKLKGSAEIITWLKKRLPKRQP